MAMNGNRDANSRTIVARAGQRPAAAVQNTSSTQRQRQRACPRVINRRHWSHPPVALTAACARCDPCGGRRPGGISARRIRLERTCNARAAADEENRGRAAGMVTYSTSHARNISPPYLQTIKLDNSAGSSSISSSSSSSGRSLLNAHNLARKVAIRVDKNARQRRIRIIRNAVVVHDAHEFNRRKFGGQLPESCLGRV